MNCWGGGDTIQSKAHLAPVLSPPGEEYRAILSCLEDGPSRLGGLSSRR